MWLPNAIWYDLKSAVNTGELTRSSLIEKLYFVQTRADLEQLRRELWQLQHRLRAPVRDNRIDILAAGNSDEQHSSSKGNTPGALTLDADKLYLATQTTQTGTSSTSQGHDLVWQKAKGEGASDQTTNYNQFNAGTLATPVNSVQAGLGARDSIESLAQQPGMAWVNQIANDPNLAGKVDWVKVEEAHTSWDYKQQGLTPGGAALLTLATAYFTAGAVSGFGAAAGDAAATAATGGVAALGEGGFIAAGGVTLSSVVGGAVTAGLTALAAQTAVALANNQFDLGGALHDLGSSASVHGLLTAIATGGVLGGLNMNPTGLPTTGGGAQGFMVQLGQNLQAGAARAVIGTAINGGSLEDALKQNLKNAFIDTFAAQGAFAIGNWTQAGILDDVTNKMAHAIAGCAAGVARADSAGGCSAGALGASMGEMAAELYGRDIDTVQFAAMMGGLAVAMAGGDAAEISLASQAAGNAAANNWLATQQRAQMKRELDARIDRMQTALEVGGDQNAEQLGKDLGSLVWDAAQGGGRPHRRQASWGPRMPAPSNPFALDHPPHLRPR